MNDGLDIAMRHILHKLYKPYSYSVSTEQLYDKLIDDGLPPQDNEMSEIIQSWKKQSLIMGSGFQDAGAIQQHGAFTITWVSSRL